VLRFTFSLEEERDYDIIVLTGEQAEEAGEAIAPFVTENCLVVFENMTLEQVQNATGLAEGFSDEKSSSNVSLSVWKHKLQVIIEFLIIIAEHISRRIRNVFVCQPVNNSVFGFKAAQPERAALHHHQADACVTAAFLIRKPFGKPGCILDLFKRHVCSAIIIKNSIMT